MSARTRSASLIAVSALALAAAEACQSAASGPASSPASAATQAVAPAAARDSFADRRDSAMARVLRSIAGRENQPAESVFRNIKVLKGVPAGRVPRIMNLGYGRSLGVGCTHCHVPGQWASDEKPTKQIARDMVAMVEDINTRQLPKIANLKSPTPSVNCATCHRGSAKPALGL
jgi:hypothetical protein